MNNYDNALNVLVKSIYDYIRRCIKHLSFDVTKYGLIKEVLGNNKYSVQIQGTVYAVPCATDQIFKINETVLVLCVQNDEKNKYIIGRS